VNYTTWYPNRDFLNYLLSLLYPLLYIDISALGRASQEHVEQVKR